MSEKSKNLHGGSGSATGQPHVPEPTFAERVRTLLHIAENGMLSTQSVRQPGFPFGSLMPFGLDGQGRPLFLISTMAMHTQNLNEDARASLLVVQPDCAGEILGAARATLLGRVEAVPPAESGDVREAYLAQHPNAKYWVDYDDFAFYRMNVIDIYYVGGFGVMGWVEADSYSAAEPDPLADAAGGIIEHMNADHVEAMVLLAHAQLGFEADNAEMTAVDRLGFHVKLQSAQGYKGARLAFPYEVNSPEKARAAFVEMVRKAREEHDSAS